MSFVFNIYVIRVPSQTALGQQITKIALDNILRVRYSDSGESGDRSRLQRQIERLAAGRLRNFWTTRALALWKLQAR
jgi:hypothetical protein